MKKLFAIAGIAMLTATLSTAAPAQAADLCVQFDGGSCALSGDPGFFRFLGAKMPKSNKKAVHLGGRACGTGIVEGLALMNKEKTAIDIRGTFVCDGVPGIIEASFAPGATSGSGSATFGTFEEANACTVEIVDCTTEP